MGGSRSRALVAATVAVALAAVSGIGGARRAYATDLDTLRARAQRVADEVTALEHRLQDLDDGQSRLEHDIDVANKEIALLAVEIHDAEAAYRDALAGYVEKAIEVYKSGGTPRLDLILSARTISQLFTIEKATSLSTEEAAAALEEVTRVRDAAQANQERIVVRKQRLLTMEAQVDAVVEDIRHTLTTRRLTLRNLMSEIDRLEQEARRRAAAAAAAARAATPGAELLEILHPSGPAQGIPEGFASTGVSFEGVASWYGPGFEGNPTASGQIFDPSLYTAASKELPLGTWLFVQHAGRGVVVLVNDRGPYVEGRILDLSQAAARAVGITGLGWVRAEILVRL